MEMYFSPHNFFPWKGAVHLFFFWTKCVKGQCVKSLWRLLIYLSPLWIKGPLKRGKKSFRLTKCDTRSKFWQHHKQLNPYFSALRREGDGKYWLAVDVTTFLATLVFRHLWLEAVHWCNQWYQRHAEARVSSSSHFFKLDAQWYHC